MTELLNPDNCYQGVRVALLGASGFIGRWVARALVARGAKLSMIVRNNHVADKIFSKYSIDGDIFEIDLRDSGAVLQFFQNMRPSITFNLAGYGIDQSERDEISAFKINADLVDRVCHAIAGKIDPFWCGQDIIHVGSALEYGLIGGHLSEDASPNPTTLYGRSKLAGTNILAHSCSSYRIKGLTARLFTVYGPGEHPGRLLPSLLKTARTGRPLPLTAGDQRRDFTYVEDVAEGLLRLGLAPAMPGEIVNMATGQLTSVRSFAETAARILQIPNYRLKFGSIPTRNEEMNHFNVTLTRLRRLIVWMPSTGVTEGITNTFNFETRNGDGHD